MPFISYAQNFEDLMLFRALRSVTNGFFVDVGAAHPESHSVTKSFYDRGWLGINLEPNQANYARLVAGRLNDINLCAAASDQSGPGTFYLVDGDSGLCTTNRALADWHRTQGRTIEEEPVTFVTLAEVCARHVGARDIHFLKIDAEGAELKVLRGHDFRRWRPWIVLFEAHDAERSTTGWVPCEQLLTDAGYRFVYSDGLNRFYVDGARHDQLARAFEVPPNTYGDWILAEHHFLRNEAAARR
jgi:FkbM family methyltransferase